MLSLVLCACGPEDAPSSQSALVDATQTIALDYQASQDLTAARSQLQALDVANVNQWIIYTTESAITKNESTAETSALVTLVLDLGLRSNTIATYARQNGLQTAPVASGGFQAPSNSGNADATATNNEGAVQVQNNLGAILVPLPSDSDPSGSDQGQAENGTGEQVNSANEQLIQVRPTVVEAAETSEATVVPVDKGELPTVVSEVTPTSEPTATPDAQPLVLAAADINVRGGPGVNYEIAGAMTAGENAQIVGKNPEGDWWEIVLPTGRQGWVYGQLVNTSGDVGLIAVAINIPTPPPTAIPVPTEPEATPAPAPTPVPAGPDFRVVQKRIWDVVENGGRLDGNSVTCGEKRQLVVHVNDAGGNRLNGVAVQAVYGAQEIFVTGSQGKGDGTVEFVLGGGQALKVIRDVDNREVSSEEAAGLSTKPWEIPFETLIGGRFCTDDASCQSFVDATGCYGHYSWEVTFQRNY